MLVLLHRGSPSPIVSSLCLSIDKAATFLLPWDTLAMAHDKIR